MIRIYLESHHYVVIVIFSLLTSAISNRDLQMSGG